MMVLETEAAGAKADQRLIRLAHSAEAAQWEPETAIDWSLPVVRPPILSAKFFSAMVSQLFYGEIATQEVCRHLLEQLPDPMARRYLRTQLDDEARHARVYDRYLARLGHKAAMDDALMVALEGGLAWRGSYHGLIVAYQVVLESEALEIQQLLAERLPCPLLRRINARIARDEARHVAFGKIYLDPRLPRLERAERFEIYRWVKSLWLDCAAATEGRYGRLGRLALGLPKASLAERWAERAAMLRNIGLVAPDEALPD